MPGSYPPSLDSSIWRELTRLTRERWEDPVVLERLLELWSRTQGVEEAALYLETGSGLKQVCAVGTRTFPVFLERLRSEEYRSLELPGATLLYVLAAETREEPAAPGPVDCLLTAAVRSHHLSEQLKQRHFQDSYRGVELEALYDVGLAIASTLNLEELSEEILLRAVSLLDARRGALFLLQEGQYQLNRTIGGNAGQSISVDDPKVAELLAAAGPVTQDLLPGATYLMAVPIEIEGQPRGLLVVADKESRRGVGPFLAGDRRMLSLFANQAAIALENANLHRQALEKERLEREMELAAEIQRGILPKGVPQVGGFELVGWNRPTRQVGGDYYGFLPMGGQRLGLVVADVTGKGMPAALLVSTLHSALHLLLDRMELGDELWTRLNQHIAEASAANKFITLLLAELEPATGSLRFLNAGHNPGLILRPSGEVVELTANGVPLGLLPNSNYRSQTVEMDPGDLLCLYSDGITECLSPTEDEFGVARLIEVLRAGHSLSLHELLEAIEVAVGDFAHDRPQGDDQTVVLLRRT